MPARRLRRFHAKGPRPSVLARLSDFLALETDPVASKSLPRAQGHWNHRHAASRADWRPLVVHA
jgi:hypothetical protein